MGQTSRGFFLGRLNRRGVGQSSKILEDFRRYAKMQVSAKTLVVESKTKEKTTGYLRPKVTRYRTGKDDFRADFEICQSASIS